MLHKQFRRIFILSFILSLLAAFIMNFNTFNIKAGNDSLIAYWSFDEGIGNIVADSAGYSDGSLINMNISSCWVEGISGKAIRFDGIDDYIECENVLSLSKSNVFSFEVWVNFTEIGNESWQGIVTKNDYRDWAFAVGGTEAPGKAVIYISGADSGASGNVISTSSINDGIWHQLIATYNGSITRLYIDGIEEANSTLLKGAIHYSTKNLIIGNYETLLQPFNGSIDEIRLYNRVLTDREIQAIYYQEKYGKDDLMAYWSFDNSSNPGYDNSGNSNNGFVYGAKWTYGIIGDGALHFDGIDDYVDIPDWNVSTNKFWTVTALVQTKDNDYDFHGWRVGAPILGNHYQTVQGEIGLEHGKIAYNYYDGSENEIIGDSFVADGKPHFLVWRNYANNKIDMFVDGLPVLLGVASGPVKYDDRFQFRTIGRGFDDYFDGVIDEIRIYNRTLLDDEIEDLYNGYYLKKPYYVAYVDEYEERINGDFLKGDIFVAEIGFPGNWLSQINPVIITPEGFENKIGIVDVNFIGDLIVFGYNNSGDWDIAIGKLDLQNRNQEIEIVDYISTPNCREVDPKFSWDGTKIVYKNDSNISVYDFITKKSIQITSNYYEDFVPFFSPDGSKIVFTRTYFENDDRSKVICLYNLTNGQDSDLTDFQYEDYYPVFLTNDRIVFVRKQSEIDDNIWSYEISTGAEESVVDSNVSDVYPYPLKDNSDFFVYVEKDGTYNLHYLDISDNSFDVRKLSPEIHIFSPCIFLPYEGFPETPKDQNVNDSQSSDEISVIPGFEFLLMVLAVVLLMFLKKRKK